MKTLLYIITIPSQEQVVPSEYKHYETPKNHHQTGWENQKVIIVIQLIHLYSNIK